MKIQIRIEIIVRKCGTDVRIQNIRRSVAVISKKKKRFAIYVIEIALRNALKQDGMLQN